MRTMTQALLALGFVGAMAVSIPVTVKAQQNNLSSLGVDVEIGNRPDRYQNYRRQHRDFDNYFAVDRLPSTQRYYNDGYGYSVGYGYSGYREPLISGDYSYLDGSMAYYRPFESGGRVSGFANGPII